MRTVLLTVLAAAPLLADATLRGRVTDADTGRPIASTLTIGKAKSRVEGEFTKSVPAGTIRVTISRGFDYTPVERTIESRDGETAGEIDPCFTAARRTASTSIPAPSSPQRNVTMLRRRLTSR